MANCTRKTNSETVGAAVDSDVVGDARVSHGARDVLPEIRRDGTQKMLPTGVGAIDWCWVHPD